MLLATERWEADVVDLTLERAHFEKSLLGESLHLAMSGNTEVSDEERSGII